ncbi:MAG TPA: AmmeMemoRadiSam system protein A [Thermoanaerobaculia bacterium]
MLSQSQRQLLLSIARRSIEAVLSGSRLDFDSVETDRELSRPSGVFVSLHTLAGDLRGCIGSIQAVAPLARAVASSAVNAATRDPRFHPLRPDELASVKIEISVMSPIVPVESLDEIVVGRDGLIISMGRAAGLLLPQVALSYGWDREAFLSHTCTKAGLEPEAWQNPECRIERFSAEVFGE